MDAVQAVDALTTEQLDEIVEILEGKGYITDKDKGTDGNSLLSDGMILRGCRRLEERMNNETSYSGGEISVLNVPTDEVWTPVVYDVKKYDDLDKLKRIIQSE